MERKYKIGYCMSMIDYGRLKEYRWLEEAAGQCERFVLGIPDEWVMARFAGDGYPYCAEETRKRLLESDYITDVVILDAVLLSYREVRQKVPYDVCFYGSQYGQPFEEDKAFMEEKGIAFVRLPASGSVLVSADRVFQVAQDNIRLNRLTARYSGEDWRMVDLQVRGGGKKTGLPGRGKMEVLRGVRKVEALPGGGEPDPSAVYNGDTALLEEFAISFAGERNYLKKAHGILMTLMREFDRVCTKYGIRYYIVCGSLIGVVRHRGFIPWDDDIDIAIPRGDYRKLKRAAKGEWNKNGCFHFLDYNRLGNGAFYDCIPRLLYMKERLPLKVFDKVYGKATADVEGRMFLDFFVLDNAHENPKVYMLTTNMMKGVYNLMMGHRAYIDYEEYRGRVSEKTMALMKKLHAIGKWIPLGFLAFVYGLIARSGNLNKNCSCYFGGAFPIGCIERLFDKSWFGDGVRMPFGDMEVSVPQEYDAFLRNMFGDYMCLPGLSYRKPSHYFNTDIVMM